jgi:uncharacterized protein YdaU (DUF1376 family)
MNKAPAFQFYANDWLSSTQIALMTPAQEGAYIRLLCHAWNDPDCSIPDDDAQLAILSRLGEEWGKGGYNLVKACFQPHPNQEGRLVNLRLLEERKKQDEWREKSRQGGRKSAQTRWGTPGKSTSKRKNKGGYKMVKPSLPIGCNQNVTLQSSSSSSIKDMSSDIFNHWKTVLNHPKAILDAKLQRLIASRLEDGFSPEDLKSAIDGCRASAWHMGDNDRHKKFDSLSLIFRDAEHVEKFMSELGSQNGNGNGHGNPTPAFPPVVTAPPEYRKPKLVDRGAE